METLLNCAMSLNGRLALPGGKPLLLSGPEDLARVHKLRASVDGVLVGIETILADDPSLLAKPELAGPVARQPARIVLDSRARIPASARVLDGRAPCFLLTAGATRAPAGARVFPCREGPDGVDLADALARLAAEGMRRILVEGGGRVLSSFLAAGLADSLTVYVAPRIVGEGAPGLGDGWGAAAFRLRLASSERLGEGALLTFGR